MLNLFKRRHGIDPRIKKYIHSSPFFYWIWLALVRLQFVVANHPRPIRILIASDGRGYTSEQQFAPIYRFANVLRKRLGVVLQHRTIEVAVAMSSAQLKQFDLIGLKLLFRTPPHEAERIVTHFRNSLTHSATRLVYFDGDDDSSIQWPAILHAVDAYFKKHMYSNIEQYESRHIGKSNLTDYVARTFSVSFDNDIIPISAAVPAGDVQKIKLSWNVALDDYIIDLQCELSNTRAMTRDIDILCRASVAPSSWIHPIRNVAIERIEALSSRYVVHIPRNRVSRKQFLEEIQRSKICVSPFGYGEICWRDFEAVACGALLVKPDMNHLQTLPDLYVPDVTFVAVKWDYSDLEEKCEFYLRNTSARQRIIAEAQRRLVEGQSMDWFVDAFRSMLSSAGAIH